MNQHLHLHQPLISSADLVTFIAYFGLCVIAMILLARAWKWLRSVVARRRSNAIRHVSWRGIRADYKTRPDHRNSLIRHHNFITRLGTR